MDRGTPEEAFAVAKVGVGWVRVFREVGAEGLLVGVSRSCQSR